MAMSIYDLLAKIGVDTAENEPLEVWGESSIQYSLHSLGAGRAAHGLRRWCCGWPFEASLRIRQRAVRLSCVTLKILEHPN